ncbi:hypothetical protein HPP92_025982, partial [Vanilla planifolia]
MGLRDFIKDIVWWDDKKEGLALGKRREKDKGTRASFFMLEGLLKLESMVEQLVDKIFALSSRIIFCIPTMRVITNKSCIQSAVQFSIPNLRGIIFHKMRHEGRLIVETARLMPEDAIVASRNILQGAAEDENLHAASSFLCDCSGYILGSDVAENSLLDGSRNGGT